MTTTAARKAKALPPSLLTGLAGLGYLQMEDVAGVPYFRHPKQRLLYLSAVGSNIAGDVDQVIAKWYGRDSMKRIGVDGLLELLERQYAAVSTSTAERRGVRGL